MRNSDKRPAYMRYSVMAPVFIWHRTAYAMLTVTGVSISYFRAYIIPD
jgi:hypothetical protein